MKGEREKTDVGAKCESYYKRYNNTFYLQKTHTPKHTLSLCVQNALNAFLVGKAENVSSPKKVYISSTE